MINIQETLEQLRNSDPYTRKQFFVELMEVFDNDIDLEEAIVYSPNLNNVLNNLYVMEDILENIDYIEEVIENSNLVCDLRNDNEDLENRINELLEEIEELKGKQ